MEAESDMFKVPGYRYIDGRKDPQDIAEAERLLAEAGFPKGFSADLNMGDAKTSIRVGEVFSEQSRRDVGIDFTLKRSDTAAYHVHTRQLTHQATLVGGIGLMIRDPSDILNRVFLQGIEKNPDGWGTPEFEKLMDAQG